jgi:hypothetical protein
MKKDVSQETISLNQTEAEESSTKNYLEEFELINDSFPDEDPQ